MAALALVMAACSSDDNVLEPTTPAEAGKVHFTATIAAPGSGAGTRTEYTEVTDTEDEDYGKIKVAWKVDDEIAVINLKDSKKDKVTVTKVNSDGSAVISGDITAPASSSTMVELVYPAAAVGVFYEDEDLNNKYTIDYSLVTSGDGKIDGTLTSIADNFDLRLAVECEVDINGDKATLKDPASVFMKSVIAIWKLTLKDESESSIAATALTVNYNSRDLKVKPASATSELYVPIPLFEDVFDHDVTITATAGSKVYTYSKAEVYKLEDRGYYFQSTVTMEELTLSNVTRAHLGSVVTTDGYVYPSKDAVPGSKTAAAMVAYVSSKGHGLAIALADEAYEMNWSTATGATGAAAHTPSVSGQTWKLPSQDEWKDMFWAFGGDDGKYTGLNDALATAGGSKLQEFDSYYYYWSSTEGGDGSAYDVYLYEGDAYWNTGSKGYDYLVRACLAF